MNSPGREETAPSRAAQSIPRLRPRATSARTIALACPAAALLLALACQPARSLEEVEEALTDPQAAAPSAATQANNGIDEPPTGEDAASRFARVRRLFAPADVPLHEPAPVALDTTEPVDRPLSLQQGLCYTFLAAAHAQAGPIDLALHEPTGRLVAADRSADSFPVLQDICPDQTGTWTLRVSARRPPVVPIVGAFRITDRTRAATVAELDALAERFAPGLRPWSPVHTETLSEGDRFSTNVLLEAGRCYAFLAIGPTGPSSDDDAETDAETGGESPQADLDAILYRPDGLRFKQDIGVDRTPVIPDVCPEYTGGWRFTLHAYRGSGDVHWQIRATESPP